MEFDSSSNKNISYFTDLQSHVTSAGTTARGTVLLYTEDIVFILSQNELIHTAVRVIQATVAKAIARLLFSSKLLEFPLQFQVLAQATNRYMASISIPIYGGRRIRKGFVGFGGGRYRSSCLASAPPVAW